MPALLLVDPNGSRLSLLAAMTRLCDLTVVSLQRDCRLPGARHISVEDLRPATVIAAANTAGHLDGVLCWEQSATHVTNRTAAHLGLPLLWDDPLRDLRDKLTSYRAWAAAGIGYPHTVLIRPGEPLPAGPSVVKPAALQGGIGARLCADAAAAHRAAAALREALDGRGPDAWLGAAALRADTSKDILWQQVVHPDLDEYEEAHEYSAEVLVVDGRPHLLAVFSKCHVAPPYFAETTFSLPPSEDLPLPYDLIRTAVERAVTAVGLRNTMAHLEFCVAEGKVVFFELNPRLIGDPAPALLEGAVGVPLAPLLMDLARGVHGVAPGGAADPCATDSWSGFVDVRLDSTSNGMTYQGLDPGGVPLSTIEVHPVITRGQVVQVSPLRGPARVATVQVTASSSGERDRLLRHWASPERVRPLGSPSTPAPCRISGVLRTTVWDISKVTLRDQQGLVRAWHTLTETSSYTCSPAWAQVSAALPGTEGARLIVIEDDLGLLSAVPCWTCRPAPSGYRPWELVGAEPESDAILLVGSRAGYCSQFPLRGGLSDGQQRAIIEALAEAARAVADETGLQEIWAMHADDETAKLCTAVSSGSPLQLSPDAMLPLNEMGHATWIGVQSRSRRRRLEQEAARWDRSGAHFAVVPLAEVVVEAGPLLAAHNRRFGSNATDEAMRRYLELQATAFGEDAVAFTCRDPDKLLAFSYGLQWHDQLIMRATGERGGLARRDGLYFYLSLHQPVRHAALAGYRQIHLGPTAYDAKIRRGAVLQKRWAVRLRSRIMAEVETTPADITVENRT